MKPLLALLALAGVATADQFSPVENNVEPHYAPVYAHQPQPSGFDQTGALYPEPAYPFQEDPAKIQEKNALIDRQLEAFVAGPLATLVAVGLAGAIAGGFATSQAETERKDIENQISTLNKELATLEASYESNELKMDAVCAGILKSAWVDFTDVLRLGNALDSATDDQKKFQQAINDVYVWIRLHQIADKDNRCLAKLSNNR